MHGYELLNGSKNLLLDVTPLSLGIETMGGLMEKIIPRNSPIPAIREQIFTTNENGQTSIKIKILQGEREVTSANNTLDEFILSGLEPKPAGIPRIKVRFSLDVDGILFVSAIDESSGKENNLVVKTNDQLSIQEMRELVSSSIQNAKKDIDRHINMNDATEAINLAKEQDTTNSLQMSVSVEKAPQRSLPELYYQLADLEAFSFKRYIQSKDLLYKIINEYPESDFKPKAMFALVFVYESLADTNSALLTKEKLLDEFPGTDYASYISDDEIKVEIKGQKKVFMQAESQITDNIDNAIKLYKSILDFDSRGEYAVSAAYSIGYHYDQVAIIDSAMKYYQWIKENHPKTDQSIQAELRINTLNMALSTVKNDTSSLEIPE